MKVFIFGAGKVGRALAPAMKKAGHQVTLRPARKGLPSRRIAADFILLAVRDGDLARLADEMVAKRLVEKKAVCVHAAGSRDASPLAALRAICSGVAQFHPMISFASTHVFPTLARGHVHIKGDRVAEVRARTLAKSIGMTPRTFKKLETVGYHAAAGLVANGAAALAAIGQELLVRSGVPKEDTIKMLGPLLRSVAENVESLGFPDALTGPVRRGDAQGIAKQIGILNARLPEAVPLFIESARAQLPLAIALKDAPKAAFAELRRILDSHTT